MDFPLESIWEGGELSSFLPIVVGGVVWGAITSVGTAGIGGLVVGADVVGVSDGT